MMGLPRRVHTPRNDRELLCHPENVIIAGSRIKKCSAYPLHTEC